MKGIWRARFSDVVLWAVFFWPQGHSWHDYQVAVIMLKLEEIDRLTRKLEWQLKQLE